MTRPRPASDPPGGGKGSETNRGQHELLPGRASCSPRDLWPLTLTWPTPMSRYHAPVSYALLGYGSPIRVGVSEKGICVGTEQLNMHSEHAVCCRVREWRWGGAGRETSRELSSALSDLNTDHSHVCAMFVMQLSEEREINAVQGTRFLSTCVSALIERRIL